MMHKAYWALKNLNMFLDTIGEKRMLQLNELDELILLVHENAKLYKENTKYWHEKRISNRQFESRQKILLFNARHKFFLSKLKSI